MTQKKLALVAKVSTPTISRFESGDKDIQISSVINILEGLGMTDKRRLEFPDPKPEYRTSQMVVEFNGINETGKQVPCAISHEALQDQFRMDGEPNLKIFLKNQAAIEQKAREMYLYSNRKEIKITNADFS